MYIVLIAVFKGKVTMKVQIFRFSDFHEMAVSYLLN